MQRLAVVFCILHFTNGGSEVTTGSLSRNDEPDLAGWVGGNGSIRVFSSGEDSGGHSSELLDKWKVEPKALALGRNVSSRRESIVEELEVGLLEERLCRADGVRGVSDNHIVGGLIIGEELEAIPNEDSHTRVAEKARHVGEVLLGDTNDGLRSGSTSVVTYRLEFAPRRCRTGQPAQQCRA